MVSQEIEQLINDQLIKENFSANMYLSMASWFADKGLNGFANYYLIQYREELDHFLIFYHYLLSVGARPIVGGVEAPQKEFSGVKEILELTLEHEKSITESINKILGKAHELRDFKTINFLAWFVEEQVEEEDNASTVLDRYGLFGETPQGLYSLDSEMNGRTYSTTSKLTEMMS